MECGACPHLTPNTTVDCAITSSDIIGQPLLCIFSIQSVICENYTGNYSKNITVKLELQVPGIPEIVRILPYYSNKLKKLTRVHVQVKTLNNMNSINLSVSEEFQFVNDTSTATSHSVILCSDSVYVCVIQTLPTSSCHKEVCQFVFNDFSSLQRQGHENASVIFSVRAYSSNIIGNGSESIPILIDTMNQYLQVTFHPSRSCFSCQFAESVTGDGSKSCNIIYGLKSPATDESNGCFLSVNSVKSKADNTTNSFTSDPVMVYIPPLAQTGSELCFVAIGMVAALSIAVEGSFTIESDDVYVGSQILEISTSLAALLILVSIIFITVIVLLARSRARALRQLESPRDSTHQRGNVTYEEINLPPVNIDTKENVAYGHVPIRH